MMRSFQRTKQTA